MPEEIRYVKGPLCVSCGSRLYDAGARFVCLNEVCPERNVPTDEVGVECEVDLEIAVPVERVEIHISDRTGY